MSNIRVSNLPEDEIDNCILVTRQPVPPSAMSEKFMNRTDYKKVSDWNTDIEESLNPSSMKLLTNVIGSPMTMAEVLISKSLVDKTYDELFKKQDKYVALCCGVDPLDPEKDTMTAGFKFLKRETRNNTDNVEYLMEVYAMAVKKKFILEEDIQKHEITMENIVDGKTITKKWHLVTISKKNDIVYYDPWLWFYANKKVLGESYGFSEEINRQRFIDYIFKKSRMDKKNPTVRR
jgi:hypothetical protein